ncbi:MAG: arylesterase [Gammaproteobacteria bacterium]
MTRRILVFIGFAILAVYGWCANPKTLLIVGDSLSAGYGIALEQSWVKLLEQRLNALRYSYNIVNASISGATTSNGLDKLPTLLKTYRPDLVIIALGGNDGLRGLSLEAMRTNLTKMIELSKAAQAKVLLVGVRLPPNYGAAFIKQFQASFVTVATQQKVPLVPMLLQDVGEHQQLMQADGVHPTAQAQSKILDNVWPQLVPLL